MFKIYMVTNQNNGKIYIGKTSKSIKRRWTNHCFRDKRSKKNHFYNAINKYGRESFSIRQIDCTENEQEANELEKLYIGIFQSHIPKYGYNATLGGDGGCKLTEETRLKISLSKTGVPLSKEHRAHIGLSQTGKHPSEETRRKLSLARLGKTYTPETRKRMSVAKRKNVPIGKMLELRQKGFTYAQIAGTLGLSRTLVFYRIKEFFKNSA